MLVAVVKVASVRKIDGAELRFLRRRRGDGVALFTEVRGRIPRAIFGEPVISFLVIGFGVLLFVVS